MKSDDSRVAFSENWTPHVSVSYVQLYKQRASFSDAAVADAAKRVHATHFTGGSK